MWLDADDVILDEDIQKIKDLKPYDPIQGEYQIRLDANESFLSVPVKKRNFVPKTRRTQ